MYLDTHKCPYCTIGHHTQMALWKHKSVCKKKYEAVQEKNTKLKLKLEQRVSKNIEKPRIDFKKSLQQAKEDTIERRD